MIAVWVRQLGTGRQGAWSQSALAGYYFGGGGNKLVGVVDALWVASEIAIFLIGVSHAPKDSRLAGYVTSCAIGLTASEGNRICANHADVPFLVLCLHPLRRAGRWPVRMSAENVVVSEEMRRLIIASHMADMGRKGKGVSKKRTHEHYVLAGRLSGAIRRVKAEIKAQRKAT